MATDAEPPHVTALMKILEPHVHGMSLCGAGGGGFMVMITKQPKALEMIQEVKFVLSVSVRCCSLTH